MKRSLFVISFICAQLIFIFLHIHKYNQCIHQSFCKQKNERALTTLIAKKQALEQKISIVQNKAAVLNFAQHQLHMRPLSLHQVKRVDAHACIS